MDTFWQNNSDKIIVGVVTAILVLILSEPIKALFKKLGGWIENTFQAAGLGFKKRYFDALLQNHQWLKLIGIYDEAQLHPPRLKSVFVSLRMAAAACSEDGQRFPWEQVFSASQKHIVILGQPGAGKSTLLDYLILILTGNITHPLLKRLNKPLPMFTRLRDLGAPNGPQTVLEALESPDSTGLKHMPKGFFERHLRRGRAVVLLDGLDEVLDEDRHKRVVSEIQQFISEYPDNWVIVTCRMQGWNNQLPGFQTYGVQEFNNEDIHRFISAWYREVLHAQEIDRLGPTPRLEQKEAAEKIAIEKAGVQADLLWDTLRKNDSLMRIARTPLILSLITLVHKTRTDLPQGRARLYEECLEILLEKWDKVDKNLPVTEKTPTLNDKKFILKIIAIHFLQKKLLDMDAGGLETLVQKHLHSLKTKITAKDLIQQIHQRSGVLVEQAIGKYGFAHRALHDYLSASYIVDEGQDNLLIEHAGEERWREVILIAIGLAKPARRVKKLLAALLQQSGDDPASLALAGWSLAEDVQVGDDLRAEIKKRILAGLTAVETGIAFEQLSRALMDTDLPAARAWMKSALTGSDPTLRQRVFFLLPQLGADAAAPLMPLLIEFLTDASAEVSIRSQAALTIAQLGKRDDRTLKTTLQKVRQEKDIALKSAATWAWCELGWFGEIGLVKIPAGEFLMGSAETDAQASDGEKPQHTLYLPTFYIGKSPVTTGSYAVFAQESNYQSQGNPNLNNKFDHPVVKVTWHDALAFAQHYGMTLPSEAEWEKAARGTDGRIYPWGSEWQDNVANTAEYWERTPRSFLSRLLRRRDFVGGTTPVGQFSPQGDSSYGCVDMAGNVWEWTRSLWGKDWQKPEFIYPYQNAEQREVLDAPDEIARVVRGGAFYDNVGRALCVSPQVLPGHRERPRRVSCGGVPIFLNSVL